MRTRRLQRCEGCGLAVSLCMCAELPRLANLTGITLVVHHVEQRKSTNTGRLLTRVLANIEVVVRGGRWPQLPPRPTSGRRLLLFPTETARPLSADDSAPGTVELVVPDGTWRQARRASRREAVALEAEPVKLPPGPPSRYQLRRTPMASGLCTLEAVARALGILEGPDIEQAMLWVLDEFVHRSLLVRAGRVLGPVG